MSNEKDTTIIFLQNNDVWNQLLKYDTFFGSLDEIQRPSRTVLISGHYKKRNNGYAMFYKKQGVLYFQADGKEVALEDEGCVVDFQRIGRFNLFQIRRPEEIVFEHKYESFRYDEVNKADPDFNEEREEDQDFYLFIFNVMKDSGRRSRLYSES